MNAELLQKLAVITPEEERILRGEHLDRNLYMEGVNVVSGRKFLEEGKQIAVRPHTRFIHFPVHTHDYVEVIYMCSGTTTHKINGEKIVLKEGELLFLGPGATQEIEKAGKKDIAVNFIIRPEFFDRTLSLLGEEETPLKRLVVSSLKKDTGTKGYLYFQTVGLLPIQNLVEILIWNITESAINKRQVNETTMALLVLQLLNYTDRLYYSDEKEERRLTILRYIETNYAAGSLTELARLLNEDFSFLSREIKSLTGKTYTELVQEKRLSQALFLLRNTDLNISEIAIAVGYDNISYFHRLFYSVYQTTPKKFRTNLKRKD